MNGQRAPVSQGEESREEKWQAGRQAWAGLTGTPAVSQEGDDGGLVGGQLKIGMAGGLVAHCGSGRDVLGRRCLPRIPFGSSGHAGWLIILRCVGGRAGGAKQSKVQSSNCDRAGLVLGEGHERLTDTREVMFFAGRLCPAQCALCKPVEGPSS